MKKSSRFLLFGLSTIACVGVTGGLLVQKTFESPAIVRAEANSTKLEFTKACGGKGTDSQKNSWTIESDSAESAFVKERGVHYGTNNATVSYIKASCADISGNISKIIVNCSAAVPGSPKVKVEVGGVPFGTEQNVSTSNAAYTFEGSASGKITVTVFKNKTQKALYLKSIEVFFSDEEPSSSDSQPASSDSSKTTESSSDTDSSSEFLTIKKVMSNDELIDGHYLIACDLNKAVFDGSLNALDHANNYKTGNISENKITLSEADAYIWSFCIKKEQGTNYSIKSASGKYIGQTSDANGLKTSSSIYPNTITIDGGDADIVSGNAHLRFNSASDQLRFRYFASNTYTKQKAISLYHIPSNEYVLAEADIEYVDSILTLLECDSTGSVAPSKKYWSDIASIYFEPLSDDGKEYFKNLVANPEGTDSEKAMAKYDYIVSKYGTSDYADYIGRDVNKTTQAKSYLLGDSKNNSFAIIVGSVFVGTVITIGLFFALKKKKA